MRVERRAAELEELEHDKLLNHRNLVSEATTTTNRHVAAPVVPVDTTAPPWAPSPTSNDSGAAGAVETPRDLPVFTGTSQTLGFVLSGRITGLVLNVGIVGSGLNTIASGG